MAAAVKAFALASMSPLILWLTWAMMVLPLAFLLGAAFSYPPLAIPGVLVLAIYAWIWLHFRPTRFEVGADAIEVVWPVRRRSIPRREIAGVRRIGKDELRRMVGKAMRVGAGGVWGGFGVLWTEKRGVVQMYVSRTDDFVWIERAGGRPWLITPENPSAFVRALSGPPS